MFFKVTHQVAGGLPVYHTRAMRAEFAYHFTNLVSVKPAIFRAMYRYLSGDNSQSEDRISKEVDQRVSIALQTGDEQLVTDLRENNLGRPQRFDAFWDGLGQVLETELPPAAQERRQTSDVFLPVAISVRDLIDKVKVNLPADSEIPSEEWVRLQFLPKNPIAHGAVNYTGRFQVHYRVQSRSLHHDHPDTYYCMAQFKYVRSFAVLLRDHVTFICEDDKHAINVGEPGLPLASLDHNRKVMVIEGTQLKASDHDWHRFKLTPTVMIECAVPEETSGSFYSGQVYVVNKDAVFEPSTPMRHIVELDKARRQKHGPATDYEEATQEPCSLPVEIHYSDGGPDHNVRHGSVKVALAARFKNADLDMLVAGITAPGGSWINPAERVMALLNIGLNGVALAREKMVDDIEKLISNCNSMSDLRDCISRHPTAKPALTESLKPVIDTVNDRFARLKLKDNSFVVSTKATDEEIRQSVDELKSIDPDLKLSDTSKKDLAKRKCFMAWLAKHGRERHYTFKIKFQIKKCEDAAVNFRLRAEATELINEIELPPTVRDCLHSGVMTANTSGSLWKLAQAAERKLNFQEVSNLRKETDKAIPCSSCQPPRLSLKIFSSLSWVPDPQQKEDDSSKYKAFNELYGQNTAERQRPKRKEDTDATIKHLFTKEKVRRVIRCTDCKKPRVIFSDKKPWTKHERSLTTQIEVSLLFFI